MRVLSYDRECKTLRVELSNIPIYDVFDVPIEIYEALTSSNFQEQYFDEHIWGMKFEHDSHWPNLPSLLEYMGQTMDFDMPTTVDSRRFGVDTPLHIACRWGDTSAVDMLLNGGADVNAKGDLDETPIVDAIMFGRVRSVQRLLNAGALVDIPIIGGSTARQLAINSTIAGIRSLFDGR